MKLWQVLGSLLLLPITGCAVQEGTIDPVIRDCSKNEPIPGGTPKAIFCQGMAACDRGDIGGGHQYFLQAAEKGYAPAQYMAGSDLRHGYGVKKDISLAMPWLLKAAEQGLADAQNDYAKVYFYGEDGIEADPEKAIPWLRRAADQGYLHSQTLLAEAYYNATGVDQDTDKGLALYTKAAEGGHGFAQYNLGTIYSNGISVPRDDTKAMLWLEMAARRNVVEAQLKLAQLYQDKVRLNDPVKALTWFLVYAGGEGVEPPAEIATLSRAVSAEQVKQARTDAKGIRAKLPEDWRDVM